MKCFLLIVLVPSILMSQDFKREIDSLFETKKYDQAIEKMEVYLDNTPQELDLLELMGLLTSFFFYEDNKCKKPF